MEIRITGIIFASCNSQYMIIYKRTAILIHKRIAPTIWLWRRFLCCFWDVWWASLLYRYLIDFGSVRVMQSCSISFRFHWCSCICVLSLTCRFVQVVIRLITGHSIPSTFIVCNWVCICWFRFNWHLCACVLSLACRFVEVGLVITSNSGPSSFIARTWHSIHLLLEYKTNREHTWEKNDWRFLWESAILTLNLRRVRKATAIIPSGKSLVYKLWQHSKQRIFHLALNEHTPRAY